MKRSNQLIVESLFIAALLLGIIYGGSLSTSSLPHAWVNIQNPDAIQSQYNLTAIAVFYNDTLTSLSRYQYHSVSQSLSVFQFLVVPSSVGSTAQNANNEIASMNQTLPDLQYYLNETEYYYKIGALANVSLTLNSFCSNVRSANSALGQFDGPTTSSFSVRGVPVYMYHPPIVVLQNEIASYSEQCLNYQSELRGSSSFNLTISSDQTPVSPYGKLWVNTGGKLNLSASLVQSGKGVANQIVTFHVEGESTHPENLTTGSTGSISGTLTIPYFYQPFVSVWATVEANNSGITSLISNILNMTMLYDQTQIIINDPPQVLPTFPFTVSGTLKDISTGDPIPNAPVRITSFNSSYFTTTNSQGIFVHTLTVPPNATLGLHYIYGDFAPQGTYGPSINFTSIVVYRMPLSVRIDKPLLVIPGLPASLNGVVSGNGSALANSHVVLATAWGSYSATTDSKGKFTLSLSVPLNEFAFSKQVTLFASPTQAYFSGASTNLVLGLLNLIIVAIIACATGFGVYQARNLGIQLPTIRKRNQHEEQGSLSTEPEVGANAVRSQSATIPSIIGTLSSGSLLITSYVESLSLAAKKFGLHFAKSMTIRETIDLVSKFDKEGRGSALFSTIALAAEDYLYSEKLDPNFLAKESDISEESLSKLKALWG